MNCLQERQIVTELLALTAAVTLDSFASFLRFIGLGGTVCAALAYTKLIKLCT